MIYDEGWAPSLSTSIELEPIDFSPLYDWIDHDGGECPINECAPVSVKKEGMEVGTPFDRASDVNWEVVVKFKLMRTTHENWSKPDKQPEVVQTPDNTFTLKWNNFTFKDVDIEQAKSILGHIEQLMGYVGE